MTVSLSHTTHPHAETPVDGHAGSRRRPASARRIVVKVGTNVVVGDDGRLAMSRLYALAESIALLRRTAREVVLVSSGAIGLGVERLGFPERPAALPLKQACAAIGQGRLMALYADAFDRLDLVAAQVLLTEDDFAAADRSQNLHATLTTLLGIGAVPIVNENDTVSTAELERAVDDGRRSPIFGDNDKLSALIATRLHADLLVLLSDVDGVFTANPASDVTATLIPTIEAVTPTILAAAQGGGARGRGGMATKLDAARIATDAGVCTVIANGRTPAALDRICGGEAIGTLVLPQVVA